MAAVEADTSVEDEAGSSRLVDLRDEDEPVTPAIDSVLTEYVSVKLPYTAGVELVLEGTAASVLELVRASFELVDTAAEVVGAELMADDSALV